VSTSFNFFCQFLMTGLFFDGHKKSLKIKLFLMVKKDAKNNFIFNIFS
jgi:hypothetical protein